MNVRFSKSGRAPLINFIPGLPKYLGQYLGKTSRRSYVFVKFNNSCTYNGGISDKFNVLFGYTLGRGCRAYIGWRYVMTLQRVELYLVVESNPTYSYQHFLGSLNLNTGYFVSLRIDVLKDTVSASFVPALNKVYTGTAEITNFVNKAPLGWSFGISPKLNISCKPEKEINITLERIR